MTGGVSLVSVLLLLASSVIAVALCRRLKLPALLGYLVTGLALGPHAAGFVSNREETQHLAEFGVVFLMFSIGLEFSLGKLHSMRRVVFGLGGAQVAGTALLAVAGALAFGLSWQAGLALGGIAAMSSTAIASRMLSERGELDSPHGRQAIGVLLFQDLAVVPLLVLIPALAQPAGVLGIAVSAALAKAVLALGLVVLAGPRVMRAWLGAVARLGSTELFVLNVLLIILLLAFLTGLALRVALALAQGGEFGFVLLPLAGLAGLFPEALAQAMLAAMILSMLAAPFLISAADAIVMRVSRSEWMLRSLELHRVAAQSISAERHVVVLGYGRNGQRLARLLEAEGVRYVALDLDPERVREAALAGDNVVFADSSRREALIAAGISRAVAAVITFADVRASLRVLAHIHALNPAVPVIVRARDEGDIAPLSAACGTEGVPEAFQSGGTLPLHNPPREGVSL